MIDGQVAIVLSLFTLIFFIVTFWFSQLRGPSISTIEEIEMGELSVLPKVRTSIDVKSLTFDIRIAIANNSGRMGMITKPRISFAATTDLKGDELTVSIDDFNIEPPDVQSGEQYMRRSFLSVIPSYALRTISLSCLVNIVDWNYLPPKEIFSKNCNLKDVHLSYFEENRDKVLNLISKLENSRKFGELDLFFTVTKKSIPVFGNVKWTEKTFLKDVPLVLDDEYSLAKLREQVISWKFDAKSPSDMYLGFLSYIEQQGTPIQKTLEAMPGDPAEGGFPDDKYDERSIFARETLCIRDPEFGELWDQLSKYAIIYPSILSSLKEQVRGRSLDKKDVDNIHGLIRVLSKVLKKCEVHRRLILEEFRVSEA